MFSRFRREGRSELFEAQAHDANSVPEEQRKEADAVDAGMIAVASTTVNGPPVEAGPLVPESAEAGHARLPLQACDVPSEQPAADVATDGPVMDGNNGPGMDAAPVAEVAAEGPVDEAAFSTPIERPRLMASRRRQGTRLVSPGERAKPTTYTAEQRLLLLDTWRRSGLPAKDFAGLVSVSTHTLYTWKKRFEDYGRSDRPPAETVAPNQHRLHRLVQVVGAASSAGARVDLGHFGAGRIARDGQPARTKPICFSASVSTPLKIQRFPAHFAQNRSEIEARVRVGGRRNSRRSIQPRRVFARAN